MARSWAVLVAVPAAALIGLGPGRAAPAEPVPVETNVASAASALPAMIGARTSGAVLAVPDPDGASTSRAPDTPQVGCDIQLHHAPLVTQVQLGEAVPVTVEVDVTCDPTPLKRFFAVGLQGWPTAAEADAVRAAAAAFLDAAATSPALVLGDRDPPITVPLHQARTTLDAALAQYGPTATGVTTGKLLSEARVLHAEDFTPGLDHIVVVSRSGAAEWSEARMRFEIEVTGAEGIAMTRICVGGGCPEWEGVESIDVADLSELPGALTAIAARPAAAELHWLEVTQRLGPVVDYEFASAQPVPTQLGSDFEGDFAVWRLEGHTDNFGAELVVRPFTVGDIEVLGRLSVRARDTAGLELSAAYKTEQTVRVTEQPARPSSCRLLADAEVSPEPAELHQVVTATLGFLADCPSVPREADVVLAFDRSSSMQGLPTDALRRAALAFIDTVDLDLARVAILMYGSQVDIRTGLTSDRGELEAAISDIAFDGDTHLARAIDAGRDLLDERRAGALPAIVLLSDGKVRDDPVPAADWARVSGIRIAAVCFNLDGSCDPEIFQVASSQYFFSITDEDELVRAYTRLGEFLTRPDIERLSVSHTQAEAFTFAPTALEPWHAAPTVSGRTLAWHRADPLLGRTTLDYPMTAEGIGHWPLADSIEAFWRDSAGGVGGVSVPIPRVEVRAPPPEGPCDPADSAREAVPSSVSVGETLEVRSVLDVACDPSEALVEVVFALDHSFSMGHLGRLDNAKRAIGAFIDAVGAGNARFGLVTFNDQITGRIALSSDDADLRAALGSLAPSGSTNIGLAIDTSRQVLEDARPGARRVVVLLTDGDNSPTGVSILEAAGRAREAGILLVAICAGGQCEEELRLAASGPQYYYDVDDQADLSDLFARLGATLVEELPSGLWVSERLHGGFEFLSGDPEPTAAPPPVLPQLDWQFGVQPTGGQPFAYTVTARKPGTRPVSLWGRVEYAMVGGGSGVFYLEPVPVNVAGEVPPRLPTAGILPTSTPEPTHVPPDMTVTVSPTATADGTETPGHDVRFRLYVPVVEQGRQR